MQSKFHPEDFRALCVQILNSEIPGKRRAYILQEAFVWAKAPKGQYFWHKQTVRLKNGKDLSYEARDALRSFNSVRHLEPIDKVENLKALRRLFGLIK